jgi:hypothetical protein
MDHRGRDERERLEEDEAAERVAALAVVSGDPVGPVVCRVVAIKLL